MINHQKIIFIVLCAFLTSGLFAIAGVAEAAGITTLNSAEAFKSITLDGVLGGTEWNDAQNYSLEYNVANRYTVDNLLKLYLKNDQQNLYVGVKIENANLSSYHSELNMTFDVDNSSGLSLNDISYDICPGWNFYNIYKYVHNSNSGKDEWNRKNDYLGCQSLVDGINTTEVKVEGLATIQFEVAIPLSSIGIVAGQSIKIQIRYYEQYDLVEFSNYPNESYVTLTTTETTHNYYFFLAKPVLTVTQAANHTQVILNWTQVPGATIYRVYRTSTDSICFDDYDWGDWIISNTTGLGLIVDNRFPSINHTDYFTVLAEGLPMQNIPSQSETIQWDWVAENGGSDDDSSPEENGDSDDDSSPDLVIAGFPLGFITIIGLSALLIIKKKYV